MKILAIIATLLQWGLRAYYHYKDNSFYDVLGFVFFDDKKKNMGELKVIIITAFVSLTLNLSSSLSGLLPKGFAWDVDLPSLMEQLTNLGSLLAAFAALWMVWRRNRKDNAEIININADTKLKKLEFEKLSLEKAREVIKNHEDEKTI